MNKIILAFIIYSLITLLGCKKNNCDVTKAYLRSEVFNDSLINSFDLRINKDTVIVHFEIPENCSKVDYLQYYSLIALNKLQYKCDKNYYKVLGLKSDEKVLWVENDKMNWTIKDSIPIKFRNMIYYLANRMDPIYADYLRHYDSILAGFSDGVPWFETDKTFIEYMYSCSNDSTRYEKVMCTMVSSAVKQLLANPRLSIPQEAQGEYDSIMSILNISLTKGDSLLNEYRE